MKGLYSWRLASLSSFHFLVSHPLAVLQHLPFTLVLWALQLHAGGVLTNCTEANLRSAMAGGGTVTFACDGVITLMSEITNERAHLTITNDMVFDASGHTVSLSGNNGNRIFWVENAARLSLINLTLKE